MRSRSRNTASSLPSSGFPSTWWRIAAPAVFGLALTVLGCGHPATREECAELFAKIAALELHTQQVTDPRILEERIAAARTAPQGTEFMAQCTGKRITDKTLSCLHQAATAEQFDRCF